MVYPRIHEPVIYNWELNETNSRYEYPRAWPSHHDLHIEFAVLATVNAMVACTTFILVIALIRSKRVHTNPLNLYLLFIAIPDFLASFLCLVTCAMSAPRWRYYGEAMCGFQSFYLNFAFTSNAWLNGVIVSQIHRLLRHSNVRRRYKPPQHKQVIKHAAIVYAYGLLWGLLCAFNISFLPHSSHLYYGFACMPMEYNTASTLFFWLVYIPLTLGIPIVYAGYVVIDIYRKQLLPPTGRRRKLSLFLLRLCFLYFAIWLPFLVLLTIGNFVVVGQLVTYVGAILSHLQGMLSALFCLTNEDIRRAYWMVLTCQSTAAEEQQQQQDGSSGGFSLGSSRAFKSLRDSFGFNVSRRFAFAPDEDSTGRPSSTMCHSHKAHGNSSSNAHETTHDDENPTTFLAEEEGDKTERATNKLLDASIQDLPYGLDNPFSDSSSDDDEEAETEDHIEIGGNTKSVSSPPQSTFLDEEAKAEER